MKTIYMVRENGDTDWFMSYDHEHWDESREASDKDMTTKRLAEFLDMDAEGSNYHDLVGCHSGLAKIIAEQSDAEVARKTLIEIAKRGGIYGLC